VRIGIGHPGAKEMVMPHALGDFARAETPDLEKTIDAVAEALPLLVAGQDNAFMTKVDVLTKPPAPPKPPPSPPKKQERD
jgi:PTH1 family peptidyl-tRNA hydrolase